MLLRDRTIAAVRYCLPPGVDLRRCRPEPVGESLADSTTLEQEVQSLRDRLFRLSAASLGINESLDFEGSAGGFGGRPGGHRCTVWRDVTGG